MDDSEKQLKPRAGDTIDLHDEYDVRQWTEIFNISAVALHDAVHAVGPSRADVKRHVRANRR